MAEFRLRDNAADQRMADTPSLIAYLPCILRYPLSGHALPALVMFTAFLWTGLQSVLGIALLAIVSPWVLHYAEGVIERTSLGQATPPAFGGDMIFLGSVSAFRPLMGLGLIAGAFFALQPVGPGSAALALAAGAFLFPAFMLVLAVQGSLLAAVNPLRLLHAIVGTGPAYLVVCIVLAGAAAGAALLASQAALALALFIAIYTWLMACHLLGFAVFHRAEQLGLAVRSRLAPEERQQREQQQVRLAAVLAKIDAALARKDFQSAADALYAEPGGPADVRQFHEDVFEQLQRRRDPALLHAQGQRLIGVLVRIKQWPRALDIAEICFDAHRDFVPEPPAQAEVLAEQALKDRRHGLFERFIRDANVRYESDTAISLGFLAAQYWCDHRRDDDRALRESEC